MTIERRPGPGHGARSAFVHPLAVPASHANTERTHAMPAENETTGEPIVLDWRGLSLTIPASLDDCPVEVLEAFESRRSIAAMVGILGTAQYDRVKAAGITVREFGELSDRIAVAYGLGSAGE